MSSPAITHWVGIDIAAKTFTATWTPQGPTKSRTFDQSPSGYAAFISQLGPADPATVLVGMEATGSYWVALAVALHAAGYHVTVINPAHLANFAKSLPRRAKTDCLDAVVVCQFVRERTPAPWTPPPAVYHELRQRLVARDALQEMRQQARNQLHALAQWPVQVAAVTMHMQDVIATLTTQIDQLEAELDDHLRDGAWAESVTLLDTIPGLGLLTMAWVLVATINFELCASPESAAAYAGLAPMAHESGTSVRGRARIGTSGHGRLRKALYMATLSASRSNPLIRTFFQRLRAAGKPFKVAQCAAARKLLHIAWAVVTKKQRFDQYHGQGSTI